MSRCLYFLSVYVHHSFCVEFVSWRFQGGCSTSFFVPFLSTFAWKIVLACLCTRPRKWGIESYRIESDCHNDCFSSPMGDRRIEGLRPAAVENVSGKLKKNTRRGVQKSQNRVRDEAGRSRTVGLFRAFRGPACLVLTLGQGLADIYFCVRTCPQCHLWSIGYLLCHLCSNSFCADKRVQSGYEPKQPPLSNGESSILWGGIFE